MLAAQSGFAEWPERFHKVFLNTDEFVPESGILKFQYYLLGEPVTFYLDDRLPVMKWGSGWHLRFARPQDDGSWW